MINTAGYIAVYLPFVLGIITFIVWFRSLGATERQEPTEKNEESLEQQYFDFISKEMPKAIHKVSKPAKVVITDEERTYYRIMAQMQSSKIIDVPRNTQAETIADNTTNDYTSLIDVVESSLQNKTFNSSSLGEVKYTNQGEVTSFRPIEVKALTKATKGEVNTIEVQNMALQSVEVQTDTNYSKKYQTYAKSTDKNDYTPSLSVKWSNSDTDTVFDNKVDNLDDNATSTVKTTSTLVNRMQQKKLQSTPKEMTDFEISVIIETLKSINERYKDMTVIIYKNVSQRRDEVVKMHNEGRSAAYITRKLFNVTGGSSYKSYVVSIEYLMQSEVS